MPRRTLTCAVCSKPMPVGTGSLPQGQATCQPCRRERAGLEPGRQRASRHKPICEVGGQMPCRRCGRPFTRAFAHQMLCQNPCRRLKSGTNSAASPSVRGYGSAHQAERVSRLSAMQDGDPCARCGGQMFHGQALDLDHTDDRTGYLGLSHASCNRSSTGALRHVRHEAVCDHCGVPYLTRWSEQKFCSVPCVRASRQPREPKPVIAVQLDLRVCPTCGTLHQRPRFCSNDCSRGSWRIGRKTPLTKWVVAFLVEHGPTFSADVRAAAVAAGYDAESVPKARKRSGAGSVVIYGNDGNTLGAVWSAPRGAIAGLAA